MNLTLQEVARSLRCRPSDVPLRRLGQAEGIGWFKLNGEVRVPQAELADYEQRMTVKPRMNTDKHGSHAADSPPRCGAWGCHDADLVWMKREQSRQTKNGFLIAKLDGWYCPICAGSYGNFKSPQENRHPDPCPSASIRGENSQSEKAVAA